MPMVGKKAAFPPLGLITFAAFMPPNWEFELVDLNDLSYREVATELNCPIGTVMSRLHRARKQLQEMLSDYALTEGYMPSQAHAA